MDPADPSDFLAIHTCLRGASRSLACAVRSLGPADRSRARAIVRYWSGFAAELHLHHTVEDAVFFPALVDQVPVAEEHLGVIDGDHQVIDDLLQETAVLLGALPEEDLATRAPAAAAVLDRLDDVLDAHLSREEADVVPLFARHFSSTEYEGIRREALAHVGIGRQALFTVPFVAAGVPAELRDELLADGGLPMRVLYRLTRRRHARLAAAALGPVAAGA